MMEPDFDTTLVRAGKDAATFSEMVEFAETVETRPLDKLLVDLAGLANLSETKMQLAANIVRKRIRHLAEVEREQFLLFARELAGSLEPAAAERIRTLISRE